MKCLELKGGWLERKDKHISHQRQSQSQKTVPSAMCWSLILSTWMNYFISNGCQNKSLYIDYRGRIKIKELFRCTNTLSFLSIDNLKEEQRMNFNTQASKPRKYRGKVFWIVCVCVRFPVEIWKAQFLLLLWEMHFSSMSKMIMRDKFLHLQKFSS